jgi:hypothetical protein
MHAYNAHADTYYAEYTPTCSYAYTDTCTHTGKCAHLCHIHATIHTLSWAFIHTYIHTYIHACIHSYIHTCIHTHIYIHTHIHIYIHTYIHAIVEHIYMQAITHVHIICIFEKTIPRTLITHRNIAVPSAMVQLQLSPDHGDGGDDGDGEQS